MALDQTGRTITGSVLEKGDGLVAIRGGPLESTGEWMGYEKCE